VLTLPECGWGLLPHFSSSRCRRSRCCAR